MHKKKISKKRGFHFANYPISHLKKGVRIQKFHSTDELDNFTLVATTFFQALQEDDVESALEILEGYLLITKKADLVKSGKLPSSTVYHSFSRGANPTLRTVARLLHAAG